MRGGRRLLVTGARGAGKTTFCARLAELARLEGRSVAGVLSRAVFAGGRKTGIEVQDLRTGEIRRLATEAPGGASPLGLHWDLDPEALAWADSRLAAGLPCDVLVVDELGVLEFERASGWQQGLAAVDGGSYALAAVVVRPELLARARERWRRSEVLDLGARGPEGQELDRLVTRSLSECGPRATHPDAIHWNQKYLTRLGRERAPREFLVENAALLPASGWALDVATGLGGNAGYLLDRGLQVVGIDVSMVALREAKSRLPGLLAVNADLGRFHLPPARFDVILNFYFLDRSLWRAYDAAIRPGGVLIVETLTEETLRDRPDVNPQYLLKPGELLEAFRHWEVLSYREGWADRSGQRWAVASLVARRREGES